MANFLERADLSGRRAVVIGGGAGIGRAITLMLAEAGVDLAFCDIRSAEMEETCAIASGMGRDVFAMEADAVVPTELERFYRQVAGRFDDINILVNVVGGGSRSAFDDTTAESWADDIQRNFGYVLHSFKHALPLLRRHGRGGSIINFTTIEAHRGAPMFAVYAGAKAALMNFTRSISAELGKENIRVNAIAPEHTASAGGRTPLGEALVERLSALPPEARTAVLNLRTPMKRAVTAEDIAAMTLFLASDLSTGITGMTLHADGGSSACMGFLDWPHGDGLHTVPLAGSIPRLFDLPQA